MVATKSSTTLTPNPSLHTLAGRLAATNGAASPVGAGRMTAMADRAVKGRLSQDAETFGVTVRQQPGE